MFMDQYQLYKPNPLVILFIVSLCVPQLTHSLEIWGSTAAHEQQPTVSINDTDY